MSRCGYHDDCDYDWWSHIRWRGQVASAIKGRRGQAFLRELIESLDILPEKRLVKEALEDCGGVCAIGSVGLKRGVNMSGLDPEEPVAIASVFGIASQMVREIEYMNDEGAWNETPEQRWARMRNWAAANLKVPKNA